MRLVNEAEQRVISEAIKQVERYTSAELVAVLASRSDSYAYIPLLWASLAAFLVPTLMLTFITTDAGIIYAAQMLTFIACAVIFKLPFIQVRLIPRQVRYWRAANMARRQFLEQNLHHTRDGTGVLIFVSEAEHYVEILADEGISRHITNVEWQEIVDEFIVQVKAGDTLQGFTRCIERCGVLLQKHTPLGDEDKNELADRLVIIDL